MDFLVTHFSEILFYTLAVLAVAGGIGVIALRNPVHSAVSLLGTFLVIAALFVLRHAEFLGAVQIMVYAGGIMVLFLFVIMLVNVHDLEPEKVFLSRRLPLAVIAGVLLGALLAFGVLAGVVTHTGDPAALRTVESGTEIGNGAASGTETGTIEAGNTEAVGWLLYRTYLVPFEIVSVLLLVAMIAAIIFGRREANLVADAQAAGETVAPAAAEPAHGRSEL